MTPKLRIELPTHDDLIDLSRPRTAPCVSLFLPTHPGPNDSRQDPLRLRNLLGRAEAMLRERGAHHATIAALLDPPRRLVDRPIWWRRATPGLAVLCSPGDGLRTMWLPDEVEELCVVADRFHLGPLRESLELDGEFRLLVLDEGGTRLFAGTRLSLDELELDAALREAPTLPAASRERQLQFHSGTPPRVGRRAAIFHGHGASDDAEHKRLLREWIARVESAVHDPQQPPRALVLCGAPTLRGLFRRESNGHAGLTVDDIESYDPRAPLAQLHAAAWQIVAPLLDAPRQRALRELAARRGRGDDHTLLRMRDSVAAAAHRRVGSLFVPRGRHCWGHYDERADALQAHPRQQPGDVDLFDLAAQHTLTCGGRVFTVDAHDLPSGADLPAIIR